MAKKKAPQRLAGAEESCISPEQEAIIQWFRTVKFRKNLLGAVAEAGNVTYKNVEEAGRALRPVRSRHPRRAHKVQCALGATDRKPAHGYHQSGQL